VRGWNKWIRHFGEVASDWNLVTTT
jgi:hypothetical protein